MFHYTDKRRTFDFKTDVRLETYEKQGLLILLSTQLKLY